MRRFFLLPALVLTLAACDSADPVSEPVSGFEVTVAPGTAEARLVTGDASASGELAGQFRTLINPEGIFGLVATGIELASEDSTETFFIIGLTPEGLSNRAYDLSEVTAGEAIVYDGGTDFVALAYVQDSDAPDGAGFGFAESGTLTVTETNETRISGTFTATVEVLRGERTLLM